MTSHISLTPLFHELTEGCWRSRWTFAMWASLLAAMRSRTFLSSADSRTSFASFACAVPTKSRLGLGERRLGGGLIGLAARDLRSRGRDRAALRLDLPRRQPQLGPRPIEPGLVRARVDHEEQIALLDRLVVDDMELDERAGDVRRDADHVGAHAGVVRARVDIGETPYPEPGRHRAEDDQGPEHAAHRASPSGARVQFAHLFSSGIRGARG